MLTQRRNDSVSALRQLQQDGREAISGPSNWLVPPLLEVDTEKPNELEQLVSELVPPALADTGRWHWLVGSPGNGKSAKLGRIVRSLLSQGCRVEHVEDQHRTPIDQLERDDVPYLLNVSRAGESHATCYLVQDASVVRDPFADRCDPATDLAETLRLAWRKGVSLVVCTNWGVLERLFELGHHNQGLNSEAWFACVRQLVSERKAPQMHMGGGTGRPPVFSRCVVTLETLDVRSLLVESDILQKVIEKATAPDKWSVCADCSSATLCPFWQNRAALAEATDRKHVLAILRRAEVVSGQIVVFREANALVSLLLSGCPEDSMNDGHPCDWVHRNVDSGSVFALLGRRIPAILFGGSGADVVSDTDRRALRELLPSLNANTAAHRALTGILALPLSRDVGLVRLLGDRGVLRALDPMLDPRAAVRLSSAVDVVEDQLRSLENDATLGEVERAACRAWDEMSDALETKVDPVRGARFQFIIRRWKSAHLAWLAATRDALTSWMDELDQFLGFLELGQPGPARARQLAQLSRTLHEILFRVAGRGGREGVRLSAGLTLEGRWVQEKLRPTLIANGTGATGGSVEVKLTEGDRSRTLLPAATFSWLARRNDAHLSDVTFPVDLLDVIQRTLAQAAAAGGYSVADDEVRISIQRPDGGESRFGRYSGGLLAEDSNG